MGAGDGCCSGGEGRAAGEASGQRRKSSGASMASKQGRAVLAAPQWRGGNCRRRQVGGDPQVATEQAGRGTGGTGGRRAPGRHWPGGKSRGRCAGAGGGRCAGQAAAACTGAGPVQGSGAAGSAGQGQTGQLASGRLAASARRTSQRSVKVGGLRVDRDAGRHDEAGGQHRALGLRAGGAGRRGVGGRHGTQPGSLATSAQRQHQPRRSQEGSKAAGALTGGSTMPSRMGQQLSGRSFL